MIPKVSMVCTTYGRWTSMNRLLAWYLGQDYENKELIILNTAPVPLLLSKRLLDRGDIRLVNQEVYSKTGLPYHNVGNIREDAVRLASGEVFCLGDDDDFYLSYHITNGVKGLITSRKRGWKPARSLFSQDGGKTFQYASNAMEASCFVFMDDIRYLGFAPVSGAENLSWLDGLKRAGQFKEDSEAVPSYAYVWGDPIAAHKQSGDINNLNNFENHKRASTDYGGGRPLTGEYDLRPYLNAIRKQFPELPL